MNYTFSLRPFGHYRQVFYPAFVNYSEILIFFILLLTGPHEIYILKAKERNSERVNK